MTCPYRWYNPNFKRDVCSIAYQNCPEVSLEGFDYEECSTYKEEKLNESGKI